MESDSEDWLRPLSGHALEGPCNLRLTPGSVHKALALDLELTLSIARALLELRRPSPGLCLDQSRSGTVVAHSLQNGRLLAAGDVYGTRFHARGRRCLSVLRRTPRRHHRRGKVRRQALHAFLPAQMLHILSGDLRRLPPTQFQLPTLLIGYEPVARGLLHSRYGRRRQRIRRPITGCLLPSLTSASNHSGRGLFGAGMLPQQSNAPGSASRS